MGTFKYLLILAATASLLACGPKTTPVPELSEAYQVLETSRAKKVVDALIWQAGEISNFVSPLEVKAGRSGLSKTLSLNFVAQVPDKLRLEVLAPGINSSQALLMLNGDRVLFLNRSDRTFYQTEGGKRELQALLGLPLESYQLITWLTGDISLSLSSSPNSRKVYKSDSSTDEYIIEVVGEGGKLERYYITEAGRDVPKKAFLVRSRDTLLDGKKLLSTTYEYEDEFSDSGIGEGTIPSVIYSRLVEEEIDLEIRFKKPALNQLSESKRTRIFTGKIPKSFTRVGQSKLLWDF